MSKGIYHMDTVEGVVDAILAKLLTKKEAVEYIRSLIRDEIADAERLWIEQ